MRPFESHPPLLGMLCACGLAFVVGCEGSARVVPVAGKATVEGKPLTRGVVLFNPDPAKGNDARVACTGQIKGDGRYELYTDDGRHVTKGARLGWYRVTVTAPGGDDRPLPVNARYGDFDRTDLTIEVVADPGPDAYDLKFAR